MPFDFDPGKDALNVQQHGVSLSRASELDIKAVVASGPDNYGGQRVRAYGLLDGRYFALVFTTRNGVIRAISPRGPPTERSIAAMSKTDTALSYRDEPVTDPDNPEWTDQDFANARGPEALPPQILAQFPNTVASLTAKRRGRPPAELKKKPISIRLDQDVVDHFKAMGEGWQTRMNDVLRASMSGG